MILDNLIQSTFETYSFNSKLTDITDLTDLPNKNKETEH